MSRLTEKQSAGYDLIEMKGAWCDNYCEEQDKRTCRDCAIWKAVQKLAHYEDLEEQSRLIELPCKVGDTVWIIRHKKVCEAIVTRIVLGISNTSAVINLDAVYEMEDLFYSDGRTSKEMALCRYLDDAFLTKAEAEAKLKELKEGDE